MPIFVSKGVIAEVYTKAEVDALFGALPSLEERFNELELAMDQKVDGLNGVESLWSGSAAELEAIDPKDPATVYIATDEAVGEPPVEPPVFEAADDAMNAVQGEPLTFAVADLLANDTPGAAFASFDQPANGAVTDNGDETLTYTSTPGFVGPDSFAYTITDGTSTASANVNIEVAAA